VCVILCTVFRLIVVLFCVMCVVCVLYLTVFRLIVVLFCVMCVVCVLCLVCMLCLIVVPLPPGENPFAVKINNKIIIIYLNAPMFS
jgi:hypothetical protein